MVYRVQIDVDCREGALIELLGQAYPDGLPANITTNTQLTIGDVRIGVNEKTVIFIERKTWADAASSLSDGRFREQRARMIQARKQKPGLNLIYLFEGDLETLNLTGRHITRPYLQQIQRELTYKYKIHSICVPSLTATLRYIGQIESCLEKYGNPDDDVLANITDNDGTQIGRKRGIGPQEFMHAVLSHISGISPAKAHVIVARYPTLPDLIHAYQRFPNVRDRERLLVALKTPNNTRAFGPKLSAKVYNYVFGIAAPLEEQPVKEEEEEEDEEKVPEPPARKRKPKQAVIMKRGAKMGYGKPALTNPS